MYTEKITDIILILTTIAFAVLFVSLLNYILLTLSVLIERTKSSAVYKTYGAHARNLQQMIFSESALVFIISLLAAFSIIMLIKPLAENQVGHSLKSALNPYVIWPLLGIMLAMVILMSYFPARFFSRIPVIHAFRHYQQKKNKWKLVLLSLQLIGASFILSMLLIVTLQYDSMKNSPHGYQSKGIFYGYSSGMDGTKIAGVLHELRSIPEIELVGLGKRLPCYSSIGGNNIHSPDKQRELFNIADFKSIDENYMTILDVPVTEGQQFSSEKSLRDDLLISKKCVERLKLHNGWLDGIVGKQLDITGHGESTVRGIFPDFTIGSKVNPDTRPAVFFYMSETDFIESYIKNPSYSFIILVKTYPTAQAGILDKITAVFNQALPYNDASIKSLESQQAKTYNQQRGFRNAMIAGSAIILLITIIGLIGYTTNEAIRRRKELAIRRINGAKFSSILKIFLWDLEAVAIPAVLLGSIGAWFSATKWMQNFAYKLPLHWGIFLTCSLFILFLVALISTLNFTKHARQNPIESLRYE